MSLKAQDYFCPECGVQPSSLHPFIIHRSVYRLELCYFACVECRTCGYSKQLTQGLISQWRKHATGANQIPYTQLCEEIYEKLDYLVNDWVTRRGYRLVRFRKKGSRTA